MYYNTHVLNIKISKVINTFIVQIHIFFFLFVFLFLSFLFLSGRDHMLKKVRCLFAIDLLFKRKTTQNAYFLMAGKYSREHFGTHPWLPLHSFSFIDQLLHFSRGLFFHLMLRHISSRCQDSLNMKVQILGLPAEMGGLCPPTLKLGAQAPLAPSISPPLLV